jgi:hypothetical protein
MECGIINNLRTLRLVAFIDGDLMPLSRDIVARTGSPRLVWLRFSFHRICLPLLYSRPNINLPGERCSRLSMQMPVSIGNLSEISILFSY